MSQSDLEHLSVRLPVMIVAKIRILQVSHEELTGFHLSKSDIVRKLLEEAINTRERNGSISSNRR